MYIRCRLRRLSFPKVAGEGTEAAMAEGARLECQGRSLPLGKSIQALPISHRCLHYAEEETSKYDTGFPALPVPVCFSSAPLTLCLHLS